MSSGFCGHLRLVIIYVCTFAHLPVALPDPFIDKSLFIRTLKSHIKIEKIGMHFSIVQLYKTGKIEEED